MMNAQEIRELRQRLGLTQIELAERLGTSQRVVTRWENGEHKPIRACTMSHVLNNLITFVASKSYLP